MNSFCMFCTGNRKKWIRNCGDKNCPFYRIRRADITHEDDEEISNKLKGANNVE